MKTKKSGWTRRKFLEVAAMSGVAAALPLSSVFASEPKKGGTLECGFAFLIQTPDPHRYTGTWARQFSAVAYEGLVTPTPVAERRRITMEQGSDAVPDVQPMLAESWEIDQDGKRYAFHLKKGVKFHNGKEMDSEDIKWNWLRIKDPRARSTNRVYVTKYLNSIDTPDKYTVVANLSQPYGAFLPANAWVNVPILPKDSIPEGVIWGWSKGFKPPTPAPPGTGPFVVKSYQQKLGVEFERFDDYHVSGLPYLDKLHYRVISQEQPRTMALRAGNVDYIYGAEPTWLNKIMQNHMDKVFQPFEDQEVGLTFYPYKTDSIYTIYLNAHDQKATPFKDVRVRKALALCIDRDVLVKTLFGNLGVPMHDCFHEEISPWSLPDIKWAARDIEKAKKLLAEAGYPNGLDVELKITPVWGLQEMASQIIQQMARPAGFRFTIVPMIGVQYVQSRIKYDYQAEIFLLGKEDPMQYFGQYFHTDAAYDGYGGTTGIKDPVMDELIDEMAAETDTAKRKAKYRKVFQRVMDQAYVIPYGATITANVWSRKLKNMRPDKYFFPEQAFREAWLES